jgi:hypothetical protein
MSVCSMILVTLLGTPLAILGLALLYKGLLRLAARLRTSEAPRLPIGARYAPALITAMLALAIGAGIGQGWRTSHPCQQASAAAGKLPQVPACLTK